VVRDQTREALVPCVAHEAGAGFFTCQAWGDLAENLASSLKKGQRVIVSGQLRHRAYEVEGRQRSTTEVLVSDAGPSMVWATATVAKRAREQEPEPVAS
jgi:single-strand DNA-binding protein